MSRNWSSLWCRKGSTPPCMHAEGIGSERRHQEPFSIIRSQTGSGRFYTSQGCSHFCPFRCKAAPYSGHKPHHYTTVGVSQITSCSIYGPHKLYQQYTLVASHIFHSLYRPLRHQYAWGVSQMMSCPLYQVHEHLKYVPNYTYSPY